MRKRIYELLKRLEWVNSNCPECGSMFRTWKHEERCELRALLDEAEQDPPAPSEDEAGGLALVIGQEILRRRPERATGAYVNEGVVFGYRTNREKAPDNFIFFDEKPSEGPERELEPDFYYSPALRVASAGPTRIASLKGYSHETVQRLQRELGETNEALAACRSEASGKIHGLKAEIARLQQVRKSLRDVVRAFRADRNKLREKMRVLRRKLADAKTEIARVQPRRVSDEAYHKAEDAVRMAMLDGASHWEVLDSALDALGLQIEGESDYG